MHWFDVDKNGLAKLLERKGKPFILYELIQNAWDEHTSEVVVTLNQVPDTRLSLLTVEDDNPDGFADLSHAFTLFAASSKKGDAEKRGRFNLGEKLVLSLCESAEIASTRGTIHFDHSGRHTSRSRRARGSCFTGSLRMTLKERAECVDAARCLIPPTGIRTIINGIELPRRVPLAVVEASLQTEVADSEGVLRKSLRKASVEIFDPLPGEIPMLYEMGIPVVETGDRWHVNVMQKVPLNFDRDNVPASYLSRIRAIVIEHMQSRLTPEDACSRWAREAVECHGNDLSDSVLDRLASLRFGDKRVAFDPSDPEANNIAVAKGYVVVHGGQMAKGEWEAMKRVGAIPPAGQVTPSPKPYSENGDPLKLIPEDNWSSDIKAVIAYAKRLAPALIGTEIFVRVANDISWPFQATYGSGNLTLNLGRLGHRWFAGPLTKINQLLIHEFGHDKAMNHLSTEYHEALCSLGAKLGELALERPDLFVLRDE